MCHLCRKIEAFEGFDSKATKPIFLALSKLHKHVEPRLGDLWLWRYDETTRLRKLIFGLYKTVQVAALKAILDEVDKDLVHIKKNMAGHSPQHSTGRWDALKTSISPSESPSTQVYKEIRFEMDRRDRDKRSEETINYSSRRDRTQRDRFKITPQKAPLPELPGSDIDPPAARIQQSIYLVEEWLQKCDVSTGLHNQKDFDKASMVSIIGGGIKERPKVDVGVWRKLSVRSWRARSCAVSSIASSRTIKVPITQISNCVYDKPSHKLDLDMRLVNQVVELTASKRAKHRYQKDMTSIFRHKHSGKLTKRHNARLSEAAHLLSARKRIGQRKHLMSGGRSLGFSKRSSLETVANTTHGRMITVSSVPDSISSTMSEINKCLNGVDLEIETADSKLCSMPSGRRVDLNFGTLHCQSDLSGEQKDSEFQDSREKASMSSSLLSSRQSALNFGSLLNEPLCTLKDKTVLIKPQFKPSSLTAVPRPSSRLYKPTAPVPIGRPLSPVASKSISQLQAADRQVRSDQASRLQEGKEATRSNSSNHKAGIDRPTRTERVHSRGKEVNLAAKNTTGRRTVRDEPNFTMKDGTLGGSMPARARKVPSWSNTSSTERAIVREGSDPEYIRSQDRKMSDAVMNSRRRRAKHNPKAQGSNRYHHEERLKFWTQEK